MSDAAVTNGGDSASCLTPTSVGGDKGPPTLRPSNVSTDASCNVTPGWPESSESPVSASFVQSFRALQYPHRSSRWSAPPPSLRPLGLSPAPPFKDGEVVDGDGPSSASCDSPPTLDLLSMDADELRHHLAQERSKNIVLNRRLASAHKRLAFMSLRTEEEVECITNSLMRRIEALKKEKEQLMLQVEQEEELISNTLQRKLHVALQEKIDLENQLEAEQECIVNRLHKQLAQACNEKVRFESQLREERESSGALICELEQDEARVTRQLKTQLDECKREKVELERMCEEESECVLNSMSSALRELTQSHQATELRHFKSSSMRLRLIERFVWKWLSDRNIPPLLIPRLLTRPHRCEDSPPSSPLLSFAPLPSPTVSGSASVASVSRSTSICFPPPRSPRTCRNEASKALGEEGNEVQDDCATDTSGPRDGLDGSSTEKNGGDLNGAVELASALLNFVDSMKFQLTQQKHALFSAPSTRRPSCSRPRSAPRMRMIPHKTHLNHFDLPPICPWPYKNRTPCTSVSTGIVSDASSSSGGSTPKSHCRRLKHSGGLATDLYGLSEVTSWDPLEATVEAEEEADLS